MLTASEREWLKDRRNKAYCRYCSVIDLCSNPNASGFKCPLIPDYEEAAEFSEQVAARLARMMLEPNRYPCRGGSPQLGCMRDWSNLTGPMAVHCEDCILREVRLQVEREMDGHNTM